MVPILHGAKIRRQQAGFHMDYCLRCKKPQIHVATDLYSVKHVYYVSVNDGQWVARESVCEGCGCTRHFDTLKKLPLLRTRTDPVTLFQAVPMAVRDAWGEDPEPDDGTPRDLSTLNHEERYDHLVELVRPFEALARKQLSGDYRVDKDLVIRFVIWAGIVAAVITFSVNFGRSAFVQRLLPNPDTRAVTVILSCIVPGLVMLLHYIKTFKQTFMKRDVEVPLAASLAELKPTHEELNRLFDQLQRSDCYTAKMDQARLEGLLERAQRE